MKRTLFTRAFYIPKDAITHEDPEAGATWNTYEHAGYQGRTMFGAVGFHGKAQKPDFNVYFRTTEQRERYITDWLAGLKRHKESVAQLKAQRKAVQNTLKVGDILYRSWGYDQTNVDFYQVISTTAKMITVREIAAHVTEDGFMCGKATPKRNHFTNEPVRVSFEKYSKWEGRPLYCSWYA